MCFPSVYQKFRFFWFLLLCPSLSSDQSHYRPRKVLFGKKRGIFLFVRDWLKHGLCMAFCMRPSNTFDNHDSAWPRRHLCVCTRQVSTGNRIIFLSQGNWFLSDGVRSQYVMRCPLIDNVGGSSRCCRWILTQRTHFGYIVRTRKCSTWLSSTEIISLFRYCRFYIVEIVSLLN